MDSPSATKNCYLLWLNRRYIIHFQYSIWGFVILELTKSREWVLSTLVGQKRPFLLLTGHPTSIALRTDSKNTLRLIKPLTWLRQTLLLTRRLCMRVYRVLSQNIAFFAYFYRGYGKQHALQQGRMWEGLKDPWKSGLTARNPERKRSTLCFVAVIRQPWSVLKEVDIWQS